jgi:chitinase
VSKVNRSGSESTQILIGHWRWLQEQGPSYKHQAASAKHQALELTRKNYNVIVSYKLKEKEL